jgi:hypothetical protein
MDEVLGVDAKGDDWQLRVNQALRTQAIRQIVSVSLKNSLNDVSSARGGANDRVPRLNWRSQQVRQPVHGRSGRNGVRDAAQAPGAVAESGAMPG